MALAGAAAFAAAAPAGAQLEPKPAVAASLAAAGLAEAGAGAMTMEQYLDRLMMAESGGRVDLRNSRSTAVGPYQFIERTFFEVARRNFPAEVGNLPFAQLLAKRTDPAFSRRVAQAYTRETATHLASNDIAPTWQHLRLAYIVGPGGAVRLLKAAPDAPLTGLLTPAALIANPFMAGLSVRALLARAAREVAVSPGNVAGVEPGPRVARGRAGSPGAASGVGVHCNLSLPSCRRWLALRQGTPTRVASRGGRR